MLGSTERPFAVNHPVFAEGLAEERREDLRLSQWLEAAVETQFASLECLLESLGELSPEDFPEHGYGQQELRVRRDPAATVGSQTSGGNDAMDVRMMLEFLVPGV